MYFPPFRIRCDPEPDPDPIFLVIILSFAFILSFAAELKNPIKSLFH